MPEITDVSLNSGQIQFIKEEAPVPDNVQREGNVTIHNQGRPGRPAYYDTSFLISMDYVEGGITGTNIFSLGTIVVNDQESAPYREVEDQAARALPQMLRDLADRLEKQIANPQDGS